jgi:hypothetical protein
MTSASRPVLDHLVLRSPDALVAAVPYLLGFRPAESAVVVWLQDRRIVLTQRLDLPGSVADHPAWLAAMWHHPAADSAQELILVLVTARDVDHDLDALLELVLDRAEAADIEVRDALLVDEQRWWSLLCGDERCCPPEGRPVDPATASAVAAEFTLAGRAPLPAREHLQQSLAPVEEAVTQVAAVLDTIPVMPPGPAREGWRDDRIDEALTALADAGADGHLPPEAIAWVLAGLGDLRVRDTVLWELSRWSGAELQGALDRLSSILRAAPVGHVAPVACCAAITAWLLGDGARASLAVDRARTDDPEHSLAQLVAASLAAGLPPQAWRESMSGLTRELCRHGSDTRHSAAS